MLKRFYIKASTTYDARPDLEPHIDYDGRECDVLALD